MSLTKKGWAVAAGISVVSALGVATAQTPVPAAAPAPEVGAQRDVALTPEQMSVEANNYMARMEQGATGVRAQLTQAREARDVVKVLCLNDKLNQIDVAIRSARDRVATLKGAAGRNDQDRSRHEFTVIQVLRDRVQALVAEANQCIGEETGFIGDSQVTVNIDPSIPDTDPSEPPDDPMISDPPVLSSPTQ
ncbi:MAG TPA: hypothetical protein VK524_14445 [Polyangiaceae bacterium]|nr:hypothetical protein [Polyangiaceae bacterium]